MAILDLIPGERRASLIQAMARRRQRDERGAVAILDALTRKPPVSPLAWAELGEGRLALGEPQAALSPLRNAVEARPHDSRTCRTLAAALDALGDQAEADRMRAQLIVAPPDDPALADAVEALRADDPTAAEALLRERVANRPGDVIAMQMLAEVDLRLGRYEEAEILLDGCLELMPGFEAARYAQALTLFRQQKAAAAIGHLQQLLAASPDEPAYRQLLNASKALVSG